jgi:hypothetical protein
MDSVNKGSLMLVPIQAEKDINLTQHDVKSVGAEPSFILSQLNDSIENGLTNNPNYSSFFDTT